MKKKRLFRILRAAMLFAAGGCGVMGDGPMIPPGAPPVPPAKLDVLKDYPQIKNKEAARFLYNFKLISAIKAGEAYQFAPEAPADIPAMEAAVRLLLPEFRMPQGEMTRDEAAGICYDEMQKQGLILLQDSFCCDRYTVPENHFIAAPAGKQVTLTVDGIETRIEAGKTYTGNVCFSVVPSYEITHMFDMYEARTALCIQDGKVGSSSVNAAICDGRFDADQSQNLVIHSHNDYFNPIVIDNSRYELKNTTLDLDGHGGDDFAGYGAGIMVTGDSEVIVDGARIDTIGSIRTGIWLGGHCSALIKNVTIHGHDGPTTDFPVGVMNKVPWPLGLKGNLRTTNLLEWANGTYLNCDIFSENWGALSTDGSWRGSKLTCINTTATITGESGYGAYCDMGVEDYFYGTTITVPSYGVVIGGGFCGSTFGPASEENTGKLYPEIPEDRRNAPTVIHARKNAVLIHSNQGGHCTLEPGTEFHSGQAVFLIKSMPGKEVTTRIQASGAKLSSENGVLLHLMESDDAGNPNLTGFTIPEVIPVKTDLDVSDPDAEYTLHVRFADMALQGDIYNSRWKVGQNLCVHGDAVQIHGCISSATQFHINVAPGQQITQDTYYEIGNVAAEPAPTVSNGMILVLENKSTWSPTKVSYLSRLELGADCKINGKMYVDGTAVEITPGKTYCGNLMILP